jgi:signal transduction histidine kinase
MPAILPMPILVLGCLLIGYAIGLLTEGMPKVSALLFGLVGLGLAVWGVILRTHRRLLHLQADFDRVQYLDQMRSYAEELEAFNEEMAANSELLAQGERNFTLLATHISNQYFAMDGNLHFQSWNPAAAAFTSIPEREVIGRNLYELFPAVRGSKAEAVYLRLLQFGGKEDFEITFGEGVEETQWAVTAYANGAGISVVTREQAAEHAAAMVAEKRRAALAQSTILTRAHQARAHLLAVLSHEMQTPLNGILGIVQLLESDSNTNLPANSGQTQGQTSIRLQLLRASSERLRTNVAAILDLAKAEALQPSDEEPSVDLAGLLLQLQAELSPEAERKGLVFLLDLPAGACSASLNGELLRLTLIHLLENAIEYTLEGEIRVRTWREGKEVVVEVADTGPGMTPEFIQTHIFPDLAEGDVAAMPEWRAAAGIGLALVRHMVEAMGGRLAIRSDVGKGTNTRLYMPGPGVLGGMHLPE